MAVDADQVADVEILDPVERLLAERVDPCVGLDRAGQVADVEEERLAVAALADDASGDPADVLRCSPSPSSAGSCAARISSIALAIRK